MSKRLLEGSKIVLLIWTMIFCIGSIISSYFLPKVDAAGRKFDGHYKIESKLSGKVIDLAGASTKDGAKIQQWGYSGGDHQIWKFNYEGDGYYSIISKSSGKALEVYEFSTKSGGKISQYDYWGGDNQLWKIEEVEPGYYSIMSKSSEKVLDVTEGSTASGAKIQQWGYSGGDHQLWKIEKVGDNNQGNNEIKAFPGAEGAGAYTPGGRGGKVYVVTTLEDYGNGEAVIPGSLREAVEAEGPRTIVFAVGGVIELKQWLNIDNPYLTIAGQSAPGDGITITGYPVNMDNSHDIIIRFIRFRMGDQNVTPESAANGDWDGADAIGSRGSDNIIIDHCSMSWSVDETASFYLNSNFTLQWSIISESLRSSAHSKSNHGYGAIWGGTPASFHHNLIAHHSSRNPRFDGERIPEDEAVDFRNNVIYNWGFNSSYGGEGGKHNIINNYYKFGPATRLGVRNRIVQPSAPEEDGYYSKWYVDGNYVYGAPSITADNWNGGIQPDSGVDESSIRSGSMFPVADVNTHTAGQAYNLVLEKAGVTYPNRDSIDARIIEEVRTGTATYGGTYGRESGIIDSQSDVGGLPYLNRGISYRDYNNNGIPNWWEEDKGFNFSKNLDPNGYDFNDNYTNIEVYLNELVVDIIS